MAYTAPESDGFPATPAAPPQPAAGMSAGHDPNEHARAQLAPLVDSTDPGTRRRGMQALLRVVTQQGAS